MQRTTDNFDYGHFKDFSKQGVYGIKCLITDLEYVGSSSDIARRFQKHFSELRFNRHTNHRMQEDFNKHGIDNFYYYVIEETSEFAKREVEIQIQRGRENLYNEKITGHYLSEELKISCGKGSKEGHKTDEYRRKMSKLKSNKIVQLTRQGVYFGIYNDMEEVLEKNPTFKAQPIRGVCNGSKRTAYDYIWKYAKDFVTTEDIV